MKQFISLLLLCCFVNSSAQNSVNPIIGNAGYEARYQVAVSDTSSELAIVKAHLAYAEKLLKGKNAEHLSKEQQIKRKAILAHLHTYWQAEQFPVNTAYRNERRPCFVDENKTICAVGYLIEETAGSELVKTINAKYQYAFIQEMELAELDLWITDNGFTKEEIATIQPAYMPAFKKKQVAKIRKIVGFQEKHEGKSIKVTYNLLKSGWLMDVVIEEGREYLSRRQRRQLLRTIRSWKFRPSKSWRPYDVNLYINYKHLDKKNKHLIKDDFRYVDTGLGFGREELPQFNPTDTLLDKIVLKGTITDAKYGDMLPGVEVVFLDNNKMLAGVITNYDGHFTLEIEREKLLNIDQELSFYYPGYNRYTLTNIPFNNQELNIRLEETVGNGLSDRVIEIKP